MGAYKLITVLNPLQEPQKINYTQFLFAKQIFFSLSLFKFAASSLPYIDSLIFVYHSVDISGLRHIGGGPGEFLAKITAITAITDNFCKFSKLVLQMNAPHCLHSLCL